MQFLYNSGNILFRLRDIVVFIQNIGHFTFFKFLLFCFYCKLLNIGISAVVFQQEYSNSRVHFAVLCIKFGGADDRISRPFYKVLLSAAIT